jgi:hypothetical protein
MILGMKYLRLKHISIISKDFPSGYNYKIEYVVYTNVLKIELKCPEKYIKAYIFFYFPMD